jgi:DNA ligase-1
MRALTIGLLLLNGALNPAFPATPPPVMLANVYAADADIDVTEYWVSEKYDGVRAWWDGRNLVTRAGNVIHAPAWFIAGWPDTPLDGELWIGRGQFEEVSGAVRDAVPDDASWRPVRYMVFDLPLHDGVFSERLTALHDLLHRVAIAQLQVVPQFKVASHAELEMALQMTVAAGGEGLMLHRGDSLYRAERNNDLLKFKTYEDAEARVIGHTPGKGKYAGSLGALVVERSDGLRFSIGSGFTDQQRSAPPPIGACVTFAYHGLTANRVPRFARFLRMRQDGCGS